MTRLRANSGNYGRVAHNRVKRDYVLGELAKIPGLSCPKPEGAFYVFPVISAYYGKSGHGIT